MGKTANAQKKQGSGLHYDVKIQSILFSPEQNGRVRLYFLGRLGYASSKKEKIPHNNTSGKRQVEMQDPQTHLESTIHFIVQSRV